MSARTIKMLVYATVLLLGMAWRIITLHSTMQQSQPYKQLRSVSNLNEVHSINRVDDADDEDFTVAQILESIDEEITDGTLLAAFIQPNGNSRYVFLPAVTR